MEVCNQLGTQVYHRHHSQTIREPRHEPTITRADLPEQSIAFSVLQVNPRLCQDNLVTGRYPYARRLEIVEAPLQVLADQLSLAHLLLSSNTTMFGIRPQEPRCPCLHPSCKASIARTVYGRDGRLLELRRLDKVHQLQRRTQTDLQHRQHRL
jgi:hypothetical protein